MRLLNSLVMAGVLLSSVSQVAMATEKTDNRSRKAAFGKVKDPVSFGQAERDTDALFSARPAIQRVRVPGDFFISRPVSDPIPASLLNKKIVLDLRADVPKLSDLQMLLDIQGIPVSIDWSSLETKVDEDSEVGTFTVASRYQKIANSVAGGSGVEENNNGNGNGNGNNSSYNNSGGNRSGGSGGNSNDADVTVVGASGKIGGKEDGAGGAGGDSKFMVKSDSRPSLNYGKSSKTNSDGSSSSTTNTPAIMDRIIPFRYFHGTVGELVRRLENGGNIAIWYDGGLVVGETRRYSVSVLQNVDVIQSVVNELNRLGAQNVVGSVGAGQVIYSAAPKTNQEIIAPYLRRLSGNLSEVTLQVALVTVAMSKKAERGFDWSTFNLAWGSAPNSNSGTGTNTGTGTGVGTGTGTSIAGSTGNGNYFTFSNNSFKVNAGGVFGNPLNIAGAIRFLNTFGDTSVAQNVELRTLSGAPVILRSGESIPYVSGVGNTNVSNNNNVSSNANTDRLGTGLTVNVDPRYDSSSGIVTMDVGLKLVDLVEFVQLSAGNQIGTLTQPRTREQGVNSIIRVPAGQTTIVGGIRRDLTSETKTSPFGLQFLGSKTRNHEVFWLFAVIRPVITVYETADQPLTPRSSLDTQVTVNPREPGSYGLSGVPGEAQMIGGDPAPSYYQPKQNSSTPANHFPAGVVVSAPPAPRDITVPGPATPLEVDPNIPAGAILRQPGTPSGKLPVLIDDTAVTGGQKAPEKKSVLRPMTAEEQKETR